MEEAMGLDGVELLMEVEDEFGISIDDNAPPAEGDVTVGDLYRHILAKLREKGEVLDPDASAKCLSSAAFYVFRRGLCDEFGLDRKQVRPSTLMDDLVPKADRRRRWRALGERLRLDLPKLERHPLLTRAISHVAIFIAFAGFFVAFVAEWPDATILAFFGAGLVFAMTAVLLTRPLATHFPGPRQTVRGIVLRVLAANWTKIAGMAGLTMTAPGRHSNEVWEKLHSIVVAQLDVAPEEVTRKARFYKDLGVG
jgi:acyl carrier protein